MINVWVPYIFLVVLFFALPQRGMTILGSSDKEHPTPLFQLSTDDITEIIGPISLHDQNSNSNEVVTIAEAEVTIDEVDIVEAEADIVDVELLPADALMEFAYYVHENSMNKHQTIECTLRQQISELNGDVLFQVEENNIERNKYVYFVINSSENNGINRFLIKAKTVKYFHSFLGISNIFNWAFAEGTRIDDQGLHELRNNEYLPVGLLTKQSVGLLTKQSALLLESNCDTSFLLYFPYTFTDLATHDSRTSYAAFLFAQDNDNCLLNVLADGDDFDKGDAEKVDDNDGLYSKRVSGTIIETLQDGNFRVKCGGQCNIRCAYDSSLKTVFWEYIANHIKERKCQTCFIDDESGKPYAFAVYMAMNNQINTHDYKKIFEHPPHAHLLAEMTDKYVSVIQQAINTIKCIVKSEKKKKHAENKKYIAMKSNMTNATCPNDSLYKYPQFRTFRKRIASYERWSQKAQRPKALATAGYIYTGELDVVRCFSCNLRLWEWHSTDIPWKEHAQNNPNCLFLQKMKGQAYIDEIQKEWTPPCNPQFIPAADNVEHDPLLSYISDNDQLVDNGIASGVPANMLSSSIPFTSNIDNIDNIGNIGNIGNQYYFNLEQYFNLEDEPLFDDINIQSQWSDYYIGSEFSEESKEKSLINSSEIVGSKKTGSDLKPHDGGQSSDNTTTNKQPQHLLEDSHTNTEQDSYPYKRFPNEWQPQGQVTDTQGKSSLTPNQLHSGKKHECEVCGKKFAWNHLLTRHMFRHKPTLICEICGSNHRDNYSLKRHMLTHSRKKKHSCDTCGKMFSRRDHLRNHISTHTEGKSYECTICSKKFKKSSYIQSHMQIHTDDYQYTCEICGAYYSHKMSLQTHKKIHENNTTHD
ncbi:MAG: C2H2-type zinc finger protein [Candidatus Endonucleobacter bathymodioli]|uniref:C2H2-type zinc finger protein n=1 Tax=Candidatus Endonucleibacter bathymodioli TaxID=539814 RepID=A0AA90NNP6_9GAMM|nr:C2H2-type zinc finger protein [Candidatus Endonucleobacter bathymodioli]